MSEKRQYKRWILLDKGNLQIKESIEHPGHGWADLNALLERIAELETENEWLRETLAFYADPRTWKEYIDYRLTPELYPEDPDNPEMERGAVTVSRAGDDQGKRARQVIHPNSE